MSMIFCRGCGKEIHETAVTCPSCGAAQGGSSVVAQKGKPWSTGQMVFYSLVSFFLPPIGILAGIMGMLKEATRKQGKILLILGLSGAVFYTILKGGSATRPKAAQSEVGISTAANPTTSSNPTTSTKPTLEDYQSKAVGIDYRKAMFEDYQRGQLLEMVGAVSQVIDDEHLAILTRRDGVLGYIEDRVVVTIKGAKVLENDVVKIYARYDGVDEYESVLHVKMKAPKVKADYLDVMGREE